MKFFRSQRVSKLVREELGKILIREMEFGKALVTITEVDVDKKLEYAKVMLSVIPSDDEAEVLKELAKSVGHLQHLLMKQINIKPMPRIVFEIDRGPENAAKVEKALLDE